MSRFVSEKTVEVTLADGDHVWVRERLNAAQQADLARHMMHVRFDAATRQMVADEGDWHRNRIEICRAYLVRWDFVDESGQPVEYRPALVETLDPDAVAEIAEAIDALQTARQETARKNVPSS